MPYSTETDCRLYAPQAKTGDNFSGFITQADGVIDAKLRAVFTVPLSTVPQLVKNISSKLAAGRYLEAWYSSVNAEPPKYARTLIDEALKDLQEIIADPTVLGITPRTAETADYDNNPIFATPSTGGMFDTNDPRGVVEVIGGMHVEIDDRTVRMYMREITARGMKLPLKRIAVVGAKSVLRNFREGGRPVKWQPLARGADGKGPTRAERKGIATGATMKAAKKPRTDKPLIDTASLMRSVHPEYVGLANVKICSTHPVAAFHQYGTGTHGEKGAPYWIAPKEKRALHFITAAGDFAFSKGHWHPGVVARPFMGWQDEDVKEIQRILLAHLTGEAKL